MSEVTQIKGLTPIELEAVPRVTDIRSQGEPALWGLGGALSIGIIMIIGFLVLVLWNGIVTFVPKSIAVVAELDGTVTAGEQFRSEVFKPAPDILAKLSPEWQKKIRSDNGYARRVLYRIGNFDLYGEDFRWVEDFNVRNTDYPEDMVFMERLEWGPFVGNIKNFTADGVEYVFTSLNDPIFKSAQQASRGLWSEITDIEQHDIGEINYRLEQGRRDLRKIEIESGQSSPEYISAQKELEARSIDLKRDYDRYAEKVQELRTRNSFYTLTLIEIGGLEKTIEFSDFVRVYAANDLSLLQSTIIYFSRWWEFFSEEPREANTEGGVFPAIFGTAVMTLLMVVFVTPFGVITALYLREYATQGRLVSFVRISVNNLAGVPSIVYGVFGLGFFAYLLGGSIDALFYPERFPNPTFGTGGLLWASLTLALLTVPVVIVATEEALAAVPRSVREGSLACGASKWQTIRYVVLPRAMPGIMTGIILAMARGAGEVAPLMLVGVVKLAPELPIDSFYPYIHFERSFMHLGFHIYDVGFQSRNAEAGKPMVFVTTVLLISLIAAMNATAIVIRNRLKRKFTSSPF